MYGVEGANVNGRAPLRRSSRERVENELAKERVHARIYEDNSAGES